MERTGTNIEPPLLTRNGEKFDMSIFSPFLYTLKELRLALLYVMRLHFENPEKEMIEQEHFAFYRISDFLIKINEGDFIPTDQLCGRDK
jgi:hypothetical protein